MGTRMLFPQRSHDNDGISYTLCPVQILREEALNERPYFILIDSAIKYGFPNYWRKQCRSKVVVGKSHGWFGVMVVAHRIYRLITFWLYITILQTDRALKMMVEM